ncbi:GDP-mannose 4,6-dehydratase [Actinoplanes sp. NPDC026619]|uniref:dTDP-glucose 4,6-dehydratase n=1 Tax=Actinoplanes sp. NPDC026619 TaxID=3155798 RepID=UPI0033D91A91
MHLLVTGGAGFIGSHFVRSVLADRLPGLEGASITVLDKIAWAGNFANLGPVAESRRLDFVPADVGDAPVVGAALRGHDAVVHFAASHGGADVAGIEILLAAALRHDVARFLHVSTDQVYGSIETGAWHERSPLAPSTPDAAAKAGCDLMALAYHRAHDLPVVVTRSSDNYGPYQHPWRTVPRLVTSLLDGRPAPPPGDRVRDWLHVDDHCQGLALALLEGRPGEIYHIAGSLELAERDLTDLIQAELGLTRNRFEPPAAEPRWDRAEPVGLEPRWDRAEPVGLEPGWDRAEPVGPMPGWGRVEPPVAGPGRDGKAGDRRRALDDDKIRRELGWRPHIEFTAGLASTIAWYREHPRWWRALLSE